MSTLATERSRRDVRRSRSRQVAALYPHLRTFGLVHVDPISASEDGRSVAAHVPPTITLVTPQPDNPARDHLFVGPLPVYSRDLRWDPSFEELSFATSDGERPVRGHLRLTHSRLRAFGVLTVGDQSFAVQYEVKPQRYRMKVAPDAAYLAGVNAEIRWDVDSPRWMDASWTKDYVGGFTFGVNGEEVIGDEKVYTFVAAFDDIATGRTWTPSAYTYAGLLNRERILTYGLTAGAKPPTGPDAAYFPYELRVELSEFGYDFAGGMVTGQAGYAGRTYGIIGDWAGAHIGGLYHLHLADRVTLVGVHDGQLYIGRDPAPNSSLDGDDLIWSDLTPDQAAAAGLPVNGRLTFSRDGWQVTSSSMGVVGRRIHPDEARAVAGRVGDPGLREVLRGAQNVGGDPDHTLTGLLRMSQFAVDQRDRYYDVVQEESMEDFYSILQNFMDPELRKTFFNPNPPPLDPELYGIAHTPGSKGTDPMSWYRSLSVPYTAIALAKFSTDPAARMLNAERAETWLSNESAVGDVMAVQGPAMYQRRYQRRNPTLEWFALDQRANAERYALAIDRKTVEWIEQARASFTGTADQLAGLEKQISEVGAFAKKERQYWAFAVYAYTTSPAYLNMLQMLFTGAEVDGSEFSIRVQRTVALLNVLDPTSFFAGQYAYVLQLFQLASLLPQMVDFSNDLSGFSFAVKQILDKFVDTYLDSADPKMAEAAAELRKHASSTMVERLLGVLRTSAAVGYGLNNWAFLAETFEARAARIFAGLPAIVTRMCALAAAGTLLGFFLTGSADWNALTEPQRAMVVVAGLNVVGLNALALVRRGVALSVVWSPGEKLWTNLKAFFSRDLLSRAQGSATSGLRGWLLQEAGPKVPTARVNVKQWWNALRAEANESSALVARAGRTRLLRAVFGRNLTQFMARALCAAFSVVGIVVSAIELSKGGEPIEKAANAMFLIASGLELVAAIGGWALGGSALAVGGMLVSTIFSIVAVVGFIALIVGAILVIVMLTRPQPSPVERFATEQAGTYYMPFRADIESFRIYQPLNQPQRAGVAVKPGGRSDQALTLDADGRVRQSPFDSGGHTALYLNTDQLGRVQLGAPLRDDHGVPLLMVLSTSDGGSVIATNSVGLDAPVDLTSLWYAEIQGPGTYETSSSGTEELRSAPFILRSAHWEARGERRYLATEGTTGWRLTATEPTVLTLEMVVTRPDQLTMNNVTWYTIAHDDQTGPALRIPGSLPRLWTVSPALPQPLTFSSEDGTISMPAGLDVPPIDRQTYTLTVGNAAGSVSTTFTLGVVAPPTEAVPELELAPVLV